LTSRNTARKYFPARKLVSPSKCALNQEKIAETESPKSGKPALERGIEGGVLALASGLLTSLMFYFTWVRIMLTELGTVAVANVSGAQLETGTVNLSVPGYSLPADLLSYLRISPYSFLVIHLVGLFGVIIGILGIMTARAGLRTPTRVFGMLALISLAILGYEISFLLNAFISGEMVAGLVTLSFSEDAGLGFSFLLVGLGFLISGIKMARA
jgi:hypothetical protein